MFHIKTFRLPLDEVQLNRIINQENIIVLDKKIFSDGKTGEVTVYLEYEAVEVIDG